jgi:hypothetical protein
MVQTKFPPLPLAEWKPTRDTLHLYARVLGEVRRSLAPYQKHSWHTSLRLNSTGLTTTPIPAVTITYAFTFEMALDLTAHQLVISTSWGDRWRSRLRGESAAAICSATLEALDSIGVHIEIDRGPFADEAPRAYDPAAVERFWQALSLVDMTLKRFRGEQRGETGDVQLWPHGFDLAMLWFSGRLIPGQDPKRASRSDEQMNFGFSTGDGGMPEPYFYATAYPVPEGFVGLALPADAAWNATGWPGAVMKYEALLSAPDPEAKLLDFFRSVHRAGSALMK